MPVQEGRGHEGAPGTWNDDAKALQFMWLLEVPPRRHGELGCALPQGQVSQHSLGLVDEVISLIPVCQQVRGLLVVHADVVIREQAREEVVDFPGDVQDVVNAVGTRRDTLSCHSHQTDTEAHCELVESGPTRAVRFYLQP